MKPRLVLLLLCASLVPAVCARATDLPDACGDDNVKFDVKTEKNQPAPAGPAAGKAQIVLMETYGKIKPFVGGGPLIRFAIDGAWVGAVKDNAYFALSVDPGEHHLCVTLRTLVSSFKKHTLRVVPFSAEAGKTYYYQYKIQDNTRLTSISAPQGMGNGMVMDMSFDLVPITEDEGKYRVATSPLAISKSK